MKTTIEGRELDVEFIDGLQGFRMCVMEWDGNTWQTLEDFRWTLFLLQTKFEALMSLSSALFDEAVHAEEMAQHLEIEMRYWDDVDCVKCNQWGDPHEMEQIEIGYLCEDCQTTEREN